MRDFVRYAVLTFLPLFAVRTLGASFFVAGTILSIRGVVHVLVSPLTGGVVALFSRKAALIGAFGLSAAGVALMPVAPAPLALGGAMLLYSVGDAFASPVVKDSVTDAADDDRRTGIVSALTLVKNSAQGTAPAFFGLVLAASGFGPVFGLAAAVALGYATAVAALVGDDLREPADAPA